MEGFGGEKFGGSECEEGREVKRKGKDFSKEG